ncbi:PP2C family protein-serine/threonine phosphatase [Brevibacillus nitrificans]|uniref:PP2C family protein-serine/threonine phosphatase n=1 Tax=Brevibacillus nitrificans TaxID=651560 RepID=UPI00262079B0|nr:SpoIIE family protein phosphatase [Brevibacillus nitrificans]
MIWEALLYGLEMLVGIWIMTRIHGRASARRWYHVSFLQGIGLLTWGLGNLLAQSSVAWVQKICMPACFLTYTFFLLSLHALQHATLAYESWKTIWDSITLIVTFTAIVVAHELAYTSSGHLPVMMHILGGVFLLIPAITMFAEKGQASGQAMKERKQYRTLILATSVFIFYTMIIPFVPSVARIAAGVISIAFLILVHSRALGISQARTEQPEYRYLFQKLNFVKRDAFMVQVLLILSGVMLLGVPAIPEDGQFGLWVAILFSSIRVYLTIRDHQLLVNQTLMSATRLEHQLIEQLALAQQSNQQLTQVLGLKQNYEHLLVASNQQRLKKVTYETMQQVIEELVETWYSKLDDLVYLRLSLESSDRRVYFQAERGNRREWAGTHQFQEQIVVHETLDSGLTPRFVALEAFVRENDDLKKELEQSFFQLLLVNVRDLALRCRQQHQELELRFMESEMELAKRIQSMLVPKEQLTLKSLRARSVYAPFTYVGGDYIDYIRVDERYTCFIVADVSGHGLPASLLAAGIRTAVRAVLQKSILPDEVLERLNQLLFEDLSKTRTYITMLVCLYDAQEHALLLSRAGHPQPLYLTATQRTVLPLAGGIGLGLSPDSTYKLEKVPLNEAGFLLMYTDGLVESGSKELYRCLHTWQKDLTQILDRYGKEEEATMDHVETYIWEKTREGQQTDDMSVLIIQFQSAGELLFADADVS